jgi:hypothetical protein
MSYVKRLELEAGGYSIVLNKEKIKHNKILLLEEWCLLGCYAVWLL